MTSAPAPTWWEDRQAFALRAAAEDPSFDDPPLSADVLALLDEVEAAFAVTGAETPGWEDPHLDPSADGERRDSRDEEYSRCLDPGKYRILWTRAEAWVQVLTARGWADEVEDATENAAGDGAQISWAVAPRADLYRTTVLRPRRAGAQPLVLARTAPEDAVGSTNLAGGDAVSLDLVVGFGEPVVAVLEPDCLCDACDSGSRDLLEQLDQAILSIVDGSSEVVLGPHGTSDRTSFGASSGGDDRATVARTVTAGPWADGWTPRPLCPPIDPLDSAWADEMLREPWSTRLLDTALAVLPVPLETRINRLRPGRSGTAVAYAYEPAVEQEVTAPLDALENPPDGYRRLHRSALVTGMDFEQASSAVRCWVVHRRAGLQVSASHTPAEPGVEVHLRLGIGPLRITAPCRVLWVIDEPDRAGFAYGTLPGHPETGIEEFTVTRTATGVVRFHLDAVSRPAAWYARLGAPFSRLLQELVTRRYLRALSLPARS
ncbi:DUF1990 domain-containing protein [Brachybacterium sp. AOP3-A1-3]|uniref:DUF1990 domain-containing protein n=1 Tax=Brachybacterium sp. AOP3-A1-3 TaxID=3457699 RepID=UPI00403438A2